MKLNLILERNHLLWDRNPQINVLPPSSIPSMHLTYLGLLTSSSVTSFTSFDTSFSSLTFRDFHGSKINPFVSFQTFYLSLSLRFAHSLSVEKNGSHSERIARRLPRACLSIYQERHDIIAFTHPHRGFGTHRGYRTGVRSKTREKNI